MKSGIDIKELIKGNIISVVLLLLTVAVHFVFQNNVLSVFVLAVWFIYAVYVNYVVLIRGSDLRDQVMRSGGRWFLPQCKRMCKQIDSLEDREDVFEAWKDNDRIMEMYELVCRKVENNIDAAVLYMQSYDYVNKPSARYLEELVYENDAMIEKLNALIEMLIEVKHSSEDLDSSKLDDLIESLKEIT